LIEGLVKGTTVANVVGEISCYDTKNKLFGHILLDPDNRLNSLQAKFMKWIKRSKKATWPSDSVVITVLNENEEEIDNGEGSYLEQV